MTTDEEIKALVDGINVDSLHIDGPRLNPKRLREIIESKSFNYSEAFMFPGTWLDLIKLVQALSAQVEELRAKWECQLKETQRAWNERDGEKRRANATEAHCGRLESALREMNCPRPCNHRPDDFTVGQCTDAGECGCLADIVKSALPGSSDPRKDVARRCVEIAREEQTRREQRYAENGASINAHRAAAAEAISNAIASEFALDTKEGTDAGE